VLSEEKAFLDAFGARATEGAERLDDLRIPPGNRLEALPGDRAGQTRSGSTPSGASPSYGGTTAPTRSESCTALAAIAHSGTTPMATQDPISREDLDARRMDFSEIDSGERLPPVHSGELLRRDFLEPRGLSAHALVLALHVPANRITTILPGERAVAAETALRLARHFGTSAGFWLKRSAIQASLFARR
jgi:addiction module HigA family antidote